MHAAISSTSLFIPTVGIAYSHKMNGIIGEQLEQKEYVMDINDVDYNLLRKKIVEAWENKEKIKKKLEIKIPLIKEKVDLNGILVKDFIESKKII